AVQVDNKPGKLDAVPAGAHVTMRLTVDGKTARHIEAVGSYVVGTVKAVDAGKSTLTITTKEGDKTLDVAKGAKILIDRKPGKLAALKADMDVELRMGVDEKAVVRLTAVTP